MSFLRDDVRFALRLLCKSRILAALTAGSLAIGIGATTAVFSLVDALLLHPLPTVGSPEELVAILGTHTREPERLRPLSWADTRDYAALEDVLTGLAAAAGFDLSLTHGGAAERVSGAAVSPNYFTVLGVRPAHGRLFSRNEETAPVTILGHGLWQRHFGGDLRILGSAVHLNGRRLTVIGIAPEGFWGTDRSTRREIWLPLGAYSQVVKGILVPFSGQHDRKQEWLSVLGRLAPGVSLERAQSALSARAGTLASTYPETNGGRGVRLLPLTETALGQGMRPVLRSFSIRLMAAMALVLAVAVINTAGLLLAHALARRREIAVRLSLGSSPGRIVRQLLTEGLVLGLLGGLIGCGLAWAALPLLERMHLPGALGTLDLELSGTVLAFALAVTLASCLVFALAPALQAVRTPAAPILRGEVPRGRRLRFGLREVVVGAQVALTFLILVASGLMLRTMARLDAIDPGFDPARVLAFSIDLAPSGYEGPRVAAFYSDLLDRLRRLPGVESASMASALPIMGGNIQVDLQVTLEDAPAPGASPLPSVRHALVGSSYFRTVGMKILRGRDFGAQDGPLTPGVVIVNETAARQLWPGRDPLGRRMRLVEGETPFEVIGIVADASYSSLKEGPVPVIYLSHSQYEKSMIGPLLAPEMTLLARTTWDPLQQLGAVREIVHSMDPLLPVFRVATLEDLLAATVGVEKQSAVLYGILAFVAAALAMLGLYSALVRTVVERTREIGIRVACGAAPRQVRNSVFRRSALLTLGGLAAGILIAIPGSQVVAGQLYGVDAKDPVAWCAAVIVLMMAMLLVSTAPAHRAAKVDPLTALRAEE